MITVFVHGAGCTSRVFREQLAAFPESVAVTLPGRTGVPGTPESIEAFADALEPQLRPLERVLLCGSSMGGAIALELALRTRPYVAGVLLLGSGARLRVAPALFERLENDFAAGARSLADSFFARPQPELVEDALAEMLDVGREQTIRDFRACDAFDVTGRAASLHVPLLALTGDADVLTPPKFAQWFADRVPGAEARIVPGAGHLAMIERPDETNAAIRAFARQIDAD
ncbi:MAG: alpha/beta fold hydrolase [Candidatus Eremiobacteraeota bacterium]|nr:alpha/beta fold hydrolase [Candidatus Eremiobacteraeota bacterium]MBV8284237.1 alpha/beta fold hydrolase [Candidatus Eremiobacteraeota bacterium]